MVFAPVKRNLNPPSTTLLLTRLSTRSFLKESILSYRADRLLFELNRAAGLPPSWKPFLIPLNTVPLLSKVVCVVYWIQFGQTNKLQVSRVKNLPASPSNLKVPRTSNLYAPIMLLEGHLGEVFTAKFHPEGKHLASAGFDRQIFLWNVYGQCENVMVMKGHTGAILELCFSPDGSHMYTCATDNTVAVWDVPTGTRIKKLKGHANFVNSVSGARRGPELLVSGSDDNTIKLWDARKRNPIASFDSKFPVTSVLFNDTAEKIISGGVDNVIKVWDIRNNQISYKIKGHTDTVTGMSLSYDGSYLLSNAMDSTLRIWDVRPFAPSERCVKLMAGHHHNFEKNLLRCAWSHDGSKVAAGSADRCVYIWDTTSRRVLYKLPGHNGAVNDVDFHRTEPIILSASSDKLLYLGEIDN